MRRVRDGSTRPEPQCRLVIAERVVCRGQDMLVEEGERVRRREAQRTLRPGDRFLRAVQPDPQRGTEAPGQRATRADGYGAVEQPPAFAKSCRK